MNKTPEKATWDHTKELLEESHVHFGPYWSTIFLHDPKQLGILLIRYKFAAKMACKGASVLEIGCSEGIGAPILAEFATMYRGIDKEKTSIETAQNNLKDSKFFFVQDDLEKIHGVFGAVICINDPVSLQTVADNLSEDGICVMRAFDISVEKELRGLFCHVFPICDDSLYVACERRKHA